MNEIIEIMAHKRETNVNPEITRRDDKVPAIVYGENKDPILISVDTKMIKKQIEKPGFFSRQLTININGESHRVLPKDLQLHPVKESIVHLDFLRVGEGTKVTVSIPVKFINENQCNGLKQGGVINIVRHEIEVKAPVNKIPPAFEVNLEGLEIGDSIHISSINIDNDVKPTVSDRDFTIATIAPPTVIQEVETAATDVTETSEESNEETKSEEVKDESEKKD